MYILDISSSEVQQIKSFDIIIKRDRQKLSLQHGTDKNIYGGKAVSNKYVLSFVMGCGYSVIMLLLLFKHAVVM